MCTLLDLKHITNLTPCSSHSTMEVSHQHPAKIISSLKLFSHASCTWEASEAKLATHSIEVQLTPLNLINKDKSTQRWACSIIDHQSPTSNRKSQTLWSLTPLKKPSSSSLWSALPCRTKDSRRIISCLIFSNNNSLHCYWSKDWRKAKQALRTTATRSQLISENLNLKLFL